MLLLLLLVVVSACHDSHGNRSYRHIYGSILVSRDNEWYRETLLSCFRDDGLLVHMFEIEGSWIQRALKSSTRRTFPIETDCGPYCSAYSLLRCDLPLVVYSTSGYILSCGLIHNARKLWPFVTCMAVVDSNTANRVCCASQETQTTDTPDKEPYCCHMACGQSGFTDVSDVCKWLRTGCGPHLSDLHATLSEEDAQADTDVACACELCSKPRWCMDEEIKDKDATTGVAAAWLDDFYHNSAHTRQCKFKPEEKEKFQESLAAFYTNYSRFPESEIVALNSEINLYTDQTSDELHAAFLESWLGWTFNATTGTERELQILVTARDHIAAHTGLYRPIFSIAMEQPVSLELWRNHTARACQNLQAPPYNLTIF